MFCLIAICTDTFHAKHPNYTWKDYLGFSTFILSAIVVSSATRTLPHLLITHPSQCLSFSFLYHTFSNHSKEFANTWHALDYAGICILIAGSVSCIAFTDIQSHTPLSSCLLSTTGSTARLPSSSCTSRRCSSRPLLHSTLSSTPTTANRHSERRAQVFS